MMKANSSLVLSDEAINAFWRWFSDHHHDVEAMLDRDDTVELSFQINAQIDLLSSRLAWEIGPGLVEPYMFVFPTAGDSERKMAVSRIMEKAPWIERWEFHASRPTRPFQPEIQLPDRGLSLRTSDWRFALKPSATSDRFDLQIYDDKLVSFDEKTALTAAFILLDAVLGEDIVERWIGNMKILPACANRENLPMPAIADRLAELIPR
jgi:hypothetical protein